MKYNLDRREYIKKRLDLDNRKKVLYICPEGIMFKYSKKIFCITDKDILNEFDVAHNNLGNFKYSDIILLNGIDIFNEKYYKAKYFMYPNDKEFIIKIDNNEYINYKFVVNEVYKSEKIIGQAQDILVSKENPIIKVIGKYGIAYIKGENYDYKS